MGIGQADTAYRGPVIQLARTIVSTDSPGGVPEAALGSIPTQKLPSATFHFASEFEVPAAVVSAGEDFDLYGKVVPPGETPTDEHEDRAILDLGLFRCKELSAGGGPLTVAVAICTDVLVVASAKWAGGQRSYTLIAKPAHRSQVFQIREDARAPCVFNLQLREGGKVFSLLATNEAEKLEWIQILSNPDYDGRTPFYGNPTAAPKSGRRRRGGPVDTEYDQAEGEYGLAHAAPKLQRRMSSADEYQPVRPSRVAEDVVFEIARSRAGRWGSTSPTWSGWAASSRRSTRRGSWRRTAGSSAA
jgi:hypothetical protein